MNPGELKQTLKALAQIGRPGAIAGGVVGGTYGGVSKTDDKQSRIKRILKYGLLGTAAGLPAGAAAGMGTGILGAKAALGGKGPINWQLLDMLPKLVAGGSTVAGAGAGAGSSALMHRYGDEKHSDANMLRGLLGIKTAAIRPGETAFQYSKRIGESMGQLAERSATKRKAIAARQKPSRLAHKARLKEEDSIMKDIRKEREMPTDYPLENMEADNARLIAKHAALKTVLTRMTKGM